MAKYRLRAEHVWVDGRVLPVGTEVGDGTPYPYNKPSTMMEGLDEDGKDRVNELHQELYGKDPVWPGDAADRMAEPEPHSEPVSDQQARERGPKPRPAPPIQEPLRPRKEMPLKDD